MSSKRSFYAELEDILLEVLVLVRWCAGSSPEWTSNKGENDDQLWDTSITVELPLIACLFLMQTHQHFLASQPFNHWFTRVHWWFRT